jgi:hypothetical protein
MGNRQAHFDELKEHLLSMNRLHVLLCDKETTAAQRVALGVAFNELNEWWNKRIKKLRITFGVA